MGDFLMPCRYKAVLTVCLSQCSLWCLW